MAIGTITFKHPNTGSVLIAPIGFSWTTLFFGGLPALIRGHWLAFFVITILLFVTYGFSNCVFCFIYNKMYIKYLIHKGYLMIKSTESKEDLTEYLNIDIPTN